MIMHADIEVFMMNPQVEETKTDDTSASSTKGSMPKGWKPE